MVDRQVKSILDTAFATACQILRDNRGLLDEISEYLLLKETITGDELMAFVNADKKEKEAATEAEDADSAAEAESQETSAEEIPAEKTSVEQIPAETPPAEEMENPAVPEWETPEE